jgi:hypothetical protein
MPLGVTRDLGTIKKGDTAELYASLRVDEQPVDADQIQQVIYSVQKPDGTAVIDGGLVLDDGRGFYRWTDSTLPGLYKVQVQFTLVSGEKRSVLQAFAVEDPFADSPVPTATQEITHQVWLRLEDMFDSIEGGPWLRDKTLRNFDESKIAQFIPEALFNINQEMPPTNFGIDSFTAFTTTPGDNPNMPLLVKALLVVTIRHLMRSYAEQPQLMGAQVVWEDRTRYSQIWQQLYQIEQADFIQSVRLWKRTQLGLGHSALSIFSKSGRQWPYSNQRARGAYRGYY